MSGEKRIGPGSPCWLYPATTLVTVGCDRGLTSDGTAVDLIDSVGPSSQAARAARPVAPNGGTTFRVERKTFVDPRPFRLGVASTLRVSPGGLAALGGWVAGSTGPNSCRLNVLWASSATTPPTSPQLGPRRLDNVIENQCRGFATPFPARPRCAALRSSCPLARASQTWCASGMIARSAPSGCHKRPDGTAEAEGIRFTNGPGLAGNHEPDRCNDRAHCHGCRDAFTPWTSSPRRVIPHGWTFHPRDRGRPGREAGPWLRWVSRRRSSSRVESCPRECPARCALKPVMRFVLRLASRYGGM